MNKKRIFQGPFFWTVAAYVISFVCIARFVLGYLLFKSGLAENINLFPFDILLFWGLIIFIIVLHAKIKRRVETIREIKKSIEHFTDGKLEYRIDSGVHWELRDLVYEVNNMARKISDHIQTIKNQRHELDTLFHSISDGMLVINKQHVVLETNERSARLFGSTVEQIKGRELSKTTRHPVIHHLVNRALEHGDTGSKELLIEDYVGRMLNIHVSVTLMKEDDDISGLLLIFKDTTELHRLEKIRSEFVANVSHELKTPIANIKGYAETLLDHKPEDDATQKKFLSVILRQADRLHSIVDDLLSLSRIENEQKELELTWIPVNHLVENVVQQFRSQAAKKKQLFAIDELIESVEIICNPSLLEHAISNLVQNALKYSPEGASVKINVIEQNGELGIQVIDSGPGIADEHHSRIFERFYRVDKGRSRDMGGTGLGLAIVKHVMNAHKGRVTLESTKGEGSTFTLWLPSYRKSVKPLQQSAAV